jgi:hypothetical protein
VPGTKGLVESPDDAAQESERLGFPVMLKGTLYKYWRDRMSYRLADKTKRLAEAEAWAS